MLSTSLLIFCGLTVLVTIACIAACIWKPHKKTLKKITVVLVIGCIAAGSHLYFKGELPFLKPCCTAKQLGRLMLRGFFSDCHVCDDSLALRPPLKKEYITSADVVRKGKIFLFNGLFSEGTSRDNFSQTLEEVGAKKIILCDSNTGERLQNTLAYAVPSMGRDRLEYWEMGIVTYDNQNKITRTEYKYLDWSLGNKKGLALLELANKGNPNAQVNLGLAFLELNKPEDAYFWLSVSAHHPLFHDNAGALHHSKAARSLLTPTQADTVDKRVAAWEENFKITNPEGDCVSVSRDNFEIAP